MAMGTRKGRERQEEIWYRSEVAEAPGHPFYRKLEAKLKEAGFDRFCEQECKRYYADGVGRPSLVPGAYFRLMLIGFLKASMVNEALPGGQFDFTIGLRSLLVAKGPPTTYKHSEK